MTYGYRIEGVLIRSRAKAKGALSANSVCVRPVAADVPSQSEGRT